MTVLTHRGAVRLGHAVLLPPLYRVWIATHAPHLVAPDAVRIRTLIVARGAANDVAPGGHRM